MICQALNSILLLKVSILDVLLLLSNRPKNTSELFCHQNVCQNESKMEIKKFGKQIKIRKKKIRCFVPSLYFGNIFLPFWPKTIFGILSKIHLRQYVCSPLYWAWSRGLVVKAEDSWPRGPGFKPPTMETIFQALFIRSKPGTKIVENSNLALLHFL